MIVSAMAANAQFVKMKNGHFVRDGKPYYYVGTNFWYGAILASNGQGGDRKRLHRELDRMKAMGIDNLRILVGSDGERGVQASKVEPTLQIKPGVYNDSILDGLDYLLYEMQKRKMVAVLYLNNSWEWSGGYSFISCFTTMCGLFSREPTVIQVKSIRMTLPSCRGRLATSRAPSVKRHCPPSVSG